jgi:hypothetical protein
MASHGAVFAVVRISYGEQQKKIMKFLMRVRILVQWSHFDGHEVYLPSTHMPPHTARLARENSTGLP